MQLDLFTSPPKWVPLRVADLPDLRSAPIIGVDTETRDPRLLTMGPGFLRGDAYVVGFSIACPGFSCYVPLRHHSGNIEEQDGAIRWLRYACSNERGLFLAANSHYDMDALNSLGIEVRRSLYDVQVIDAVIDESQKSYSLENIAQRRLGEGKRVGELEQVLKNLKITKSDFHKLEASYVAPYADRDASLLLEVYDDQQKDINEFDLKEAVDRECALTRTLWKMHQKGVPINVSRAEELREQWIKLAKTYSDEARRIIGRPFNPDSSKSLATVLEERKIAVPLTEKGNPSVSNDYLKSVDDPACQIIYKYRRINKIRRDYCEGVFLKYNINGRIYPQWFQTRNSKKDTEEASGATTGRITGSKPNLTQIPTRSDEGKLLREVVVAEHGEQYCKLDYSSQEPRIGLHFAVKAKCTEADIALQRYLDNKRTDYHQMTKELIFEKSGMDVSRRDAKDCNLGLTYGMQPPKLARKLGISMDDARTLLSAYHKGVPYVAEITELAQEVVKKHGYIRTWGGRLRHFHKVGDDYEKLHAAFNAAVQGSAADQMKQALINMDVAGQLPLLQVYDECGISFSDMKQVNDVVEIMENALDFVVPSLVEPAIGPNWGQTKGAVNE